MLRHTLAAGKFQFFIIVKWEQQTSYFFSWDSLTIYDGASNTSSMMGKYCGDSIPPNHASLNNEVLIHFHSDVINMEAEAGFKMEYNPTGKQITTFQNNTEYHIICLLASLSHWLFHLVVISHTSLVPGCDNVAYFGNDFCKKKLE